MNRAIILGVAFVLIVASPALAMSKEAQVRVLHASPDAPAVDIAVKDGPVLFRNVEFKEDSRYIRVPAGTYDLEVRVAGKDIVALDLPGISLDASGVYTAVAVGLLEDETLTAVLSEDKLGT